MTTNKILAVLCLSGLLFACASATEQKKSFLTPKHDVSSAHESDTCGAASDSCSPAGNAKAVLPQIPLIPQATAQPALPENAPAQTVQSNPPSAPAPAPEPIRPEGVSVKAKVGWAAAAIILVTGIAVWASRKK